MFEHMRHTARYFVHSYCLAMARGSVSEHPGQFKRAVGIFVDATDWIKSRFRNDGNIRFRFLRNPNRLKVVF